MGTKYGSGVTISGYNSSPPSDDASQTSANQVKWSTIKTKLPDPLKTAIESINSSLVSFTDFGSRQITSSDTTVAGDHMKTIEIGPLVSTSITVSLGDAATMAAGYIVTVKNSSPNSQTIGRATAGDKVDGVAANITLPSKAALTFRVANTASEGYLTIAQFGLFGYDKTDPTKSFSLNLSNIPSGTSMTVATGGGTFLPAGLIFPYAGSTVPTGWLECDGSSYSNTAYPALFAAIGTTWGSGAGTFNVPDFRDRVPIGAGTGTFTETVASGSIDVSANSLAVTSNDTKWITGMSVVYVGNANGLSSGTTYFTVRDTATSIKLATTLANAQNGTVVDITSQGTGNHALTHTYTARTLGQYGGQESHAISSTEELLHGHIFRTDATAAAGSDATGGFMMNNSADANVGPFTGTPTSTNGQQIGGSGGNTAMNIMQPFGVVKYIISY